MQFPKPSVPIDPYALGLLLGDGCITDVDDARRSPTNDPELADALGAALPGIERVRTGEYDDVLRHVNGGRGGLRIANPVTTVFRELGLAGTGRQHEVRPRVLPVNSVEVRLAVLQGLLDTDGGPVTQMGRTCRVQYTTTLAQLRDDVVFLVRSLGGVAYGYGRPKGASTVARRGPVAYRHDATSWTSGCPRGRPFRLDAQAAVYDRDGGGRPMRFIDGIEPAGEAETRLHLRSRRRTRCT